MEVRNTSDVLALLDKGESCKKVAATAMNEKSTRAHCILIVELVQTSHVSNITRRSMLFLADLGGSEKVEKSQIKAGGHRHVGEGFSAGFEKAANMREAV